MPITCVRWAGLLVLVLTLVAPTVCEAQAETDRWSIVLTPQLWLTNIPYSGFSPAAVTFRPHTVTGPDPTSTLFPQWGGQLAAQHGRWTFAVSGQYVAYETSTSFFTKDPPAWAGFCPGAPGTQCPNGTKLTTENIKADRVDIDLTASYFFPDVIADTADLSLGAGFKLIHVSGHRSLDFGRGSSDFPFFATVLGYQASNGLVTNRASFVDNVYAVTIPISLNVHLTSDKKWLLPLTLTPILGYQEHKDAALRTRPAICSSSGANLKFCNSGFTDAFAKGATADAGVRYVFDNGVALYAGYRGQVVDGTDLYVAHGPLFNVSVRFGSR